MIIIACLGNPEKKYTKTRHNIGFITGNIIADNYTISINQKNFKAATGTGKINGKDVLFLQPQTYMNNSGISVKKALDFYKSNLSQLITIHDEIELSFGDIRHKYGGGHKGHNGLRSIIQQTGSPDFHRIRFGVGRPENPRIPVADYVLSNFSSEEMNKIPELAVIVSDLLINIIDTLE